ncbi:hypothetical protein [Sciscionella sediminilitoris]|uniref:hypothetical protein n=1 Tax=Sciscionella sediminilitoris TaxID=1445613 RepID=UPI0004DF8636|nr:hypothetical protein [Sciscionella sp. SE31]
MREREGKSPLINTGLVIFALGLVAVVVVFSMFASGMSNLPLWLMICAGLLTPVGLVIGLVGLVRQHKRFARTSAE